MKNGVKRAKKKGVGRGQGPHGERVEYFFSVQGSGVCNGPCRHHHFVTLQLLTVLCRVERVLSIASKVSSGLVSKLKIKNLLSAPVGYKFKTNAPLRYSVKPVLGVLAPGQSIEVFGMKLRAP